MSKRIFLPKFAEVLIALLNTEASHRYCERLHRKTGMTVRHLRSLIADLEQMNLITRETRRKIKYIDLTETGQSLAESLLKIYPTLHPPHGTLRGESECHAPDTQRGDR